jgi:hypothetical protein
MRNAHILLYIFLVSNRRRYTLHIVNHFLKRIQGLSTHRIYYNSLSGFCSTFDLSPRDRRSRGEIRRF